MMHLNLFLNAMAVFYMELLLSCSLLDSVACSKVMILLYSKEAKFRLQKPVLVLVSFIKFACQNLAKYTDH